MIGGLLVYLRNIPGIIYSFIKGKITTSILIEDDVHWSFYYRLKEILSEKSFKLFSNQFSPILGVKDSHVKVSLIPNYN